MALITISDYLASISYFVALVYWTTVIIVVLVVVLFIYVLILRIIDDYKTNREKQFQEYWKPIIFSCLTEKHITCPSLDRQDELMMLDLWFTIRRQVKNDSAGLLDRFAVKLNLDGVAAEILLYRGFQDQSRKTSLQLLAVHVADALYTDTAQRALIRAAESDNFRVNIEATCSLIEHDHPHADLSVLSSLLQFDKKIPFIVKQVSRAGGARILHYIGTQVVNLDENQSRNILALIELSDDKSLVPILIKLLEKTSDTDKIASIIRAIGRLGNTSHLRHLIPFFKHEHAKLRLRAVMAFSRLAERDDSHFLLELIEDREWWVRYRAAQAYLKLTNLREKDMKMLIERTRDIFARDMLLHVWAEHQL